MYTVFPDQSLPFEELQIGTQRLEDRLSVTNPAWRILVSKAQCFLYCLIMACAKPVISPPMHHRERVCDAEVVTAQTLSHFLSLKDQAVTDTNLPRCIA